MNRLGKKITSFALAATTFVWLSGAMMFIPVAHGQTVADLQTQIAALLAQITALTAQLNTIQGGTPSGFTFTSDLTVGSKGEDVKALQQWLNANGFQVAASGAGSPGLETTTFGPLTRAALAKYQAANNITPSVGYFGPKTRAWVNSLAVSPPVVPPGTVPVPATGLTMTLAADNPAGVSVPFGANNVPFMKFNLSGSGKVDTITFTRIGAGVAADFAASGMYLLDETGARLTTGRTVNTTSHEVTFTGLNLNVSGVKTLTLVAAMRTSSAGAGNKNAFEINSASKISGSVEVGGSFPIRSNEFSLTSAGVPGVTITTSTIPSNPKVGELQAKLVTFKLENTSSTDDLMVNRVTLRYSGAVSRSYLSNFNLKYAGNVVATGAPVNSKDLLVLTFSPEFKLERGQSRIFELFGDVSAGTRAGSSETIKFYIEDANDIVAKSGLYGYGAIVTNSWTNATSIAIDGGQITITFNGPTAQDIPTNGQDVTVADFTVASANNVEVKNLRFTFTSTGMGGATNEKITDLKVKDSVSGSVIAGPYGTDLTTTTAGIVLSDTWTIGAGQSRRLKVTVDVGSASALGNDTAYVTLVAFNSTDIKNVDSNTDVATSDIVPNGVTGNTMTIKAPDLTVTLAGQPSSRTLSAGATNVDLLGVNLRAVSDDIQIRTIKLTASGASLSAAQLTDSLGQIVLLLGGTQIGLSKSFTGSALPLTAEFTNLNKTIKKGESMTLVARSLALSNIASSTTYVVGLADLSADITAVDTQGNTLSLTGSVNPVTGGGSVVVTLATPSLTITRVGAGSFDTDSTFAVAGGTRALTRLEFRATNGDVTVKKLQLGVSNSATTATDTGIADEIAEVVGGVGGVSLRMCSDSGCTSKTDVAGLTGLAVDATGNRAGTALAESPTGFFTIPRGETRYFVVEALLNQIQIGSGDKGDSGTSLYASVGAGNSGTTFEAVSGNTTLTTFTTSTGGIARAVVGTEKIVLRSVPTLSVAKPQGVLANGTVPVIDVIIGADTAPIAIKAFGINIAATLASVTAPTGGTGTANGNVDITNITTNATVLIASVSGAAIAGGSSGDFYIVLLNPLLVYPGSPQTLRVKVTASDVGTAANGARLLAQLDRNETSQFTSATSGDLLGVLMNFTGATTTQNASMIKQWAWADLSDDQTGVVTNTDWANAVLIRPFPTDSVSITP